jgi:alkyl hydroperoxide reductase subunit F
LQHSNKLKGDALTQEKIKQNPKVEILLNAETLEILGEKFVSGLKYKDLISGEIKELKVSGIFVEIGASPNSEMVRGLVEVTEYGHIIVNPLNQKTSCEGIWAAGDVTNFPYKQNNIAVGDAIVAVLNIYEELNKN